MLKQQFNHSHSHSYYSKPLLTWRSMQAWCLGRHASSLCRLFIRLRTRPRFHLALLFRMARARIPAKPQASFLTWLTYRPKERRTQACSCLPINIKREEAREKCRRPHVAVADATHSTDAKSQEAFKRIDELHGNSSGQQHTFSNQLGLSCQNSLVSCLMQGRSSACSEASSDLLSASSSTCSLSSSSRSSSSSGSFHRASGSSRLRETCAKVVRGSPSICELVTGNQFLVHLSAAPLATTAPPRSSDGRLANTEKSELNPSMGIVTNSTLKYKESDLKDRLVFFK
ncbi:hypothetical protein L7F22_045336 [Adiantum nelumboides]|nr:hypothetical protein [Adiantum nelumboides]